MSSSHGGGGLGTVSWFFIILAGVWVLWFFTGGPQRAAEQSKEAPKPFLKPLEPLDSGQPYNLSN